jgi:hypothetical protein
MGGNSLSLSKERIDLFAAETGYKHDMLEKASHLIDILDAIANDEYLMDRIVLKGEHCSSLLPLEDKLLTLAGMMNQLSNSCRPRGKV